MILMSLSQVSSQNWWLGIGSLIVTGPLPKLQTNNHLEDREQIASRGGSLGRAQSAA